MLDEYIFSADRRIINSTEFNILHQFNLYLNSTREIGEIVCESGKFIKEIMNSDGCHISFSKQIQDELKLETAIHVGDVPFPEGDYETKGISGLTFQLGEPILVFDAEQDPRVTKEIQKVLKHKSMIAVPMIVLGNVYGVLAVYSRLVAKYDDGDCEFLMMLGSHLGLAVENARLLEKSKEQSMYHRERADNLIINSERYILRLFDEAYTYMRRMTQTGEIDYCNQAWLKFIGSELDEETGFRWLDRIHKDDIDSVKATYNKFLKSQKAFNLECRVQCSDGEYRWVSDRVRPLQNLEGDFAGYLLSGQDITNQKKVEEEAFITSKLEAMGVLAGGLAHDFNNILSVILINISLIKLKGLSLNSISVFLTEIEKAVHEAKSLTHQLLTFAKGGEPVKEPVNIGDLLKATVSLALCGSNIQCEYDLDEKLNWLLLDKGQINQVIHNLVINAKQAMKQGGQLKISAQRFSIEDSLMDQDLNLAQGQYAKIVIQDEGEGISEANLQKIFDPYFTTKTDGNGLGLTTSYAIIKKHDGLLTVSSKVNEGTTFNIYLPIKNVDLFADKRNIPEIVFGKGKILVMDDDEKIREIIAQMLMLLGYDVDLVEKGEEALRYYQKSFIDGEKYRAVILDLTIKGGLGGKETIKRLLDIDPDVKAIVCSGYADGKIAQNFRQYGFMAFIAKPYTIEEFSRVLDQVLSTGVDTEELDLEAI